MNMQQVNPAVSAPVGRARTRPRHRVLALSFVTLVIVPLVALVVYLWVVALDQYHSVSGFTVRQEESTGASDLMGGLAQLTGSSASVDGDILYEFIRSPVMAEKVDDALDLREHFTARWQSDPIFALRLGASAEDLQQFWTRIVRISHDRSSGLIEVETRAFTPRMARQMAEEIVRQSHILVNEINAQARQDALRYARIDLAEAVSHLKSAREALTAFRLRTQIVDPEADIQGRMGVMNNLQQGLAEALIDYDLLSQTTGAADHRLQQALRRIEVIRLRIAEERRSYSSSNTVEGGLGQDYPTLIAEFEGLSVDRELAEETYGAALAALQIARAKAQRESRYLALYIKPTLSQSSEYPRRYVIAGLTALLIMLSWSILVLLYYSVRDRA